MDKTDNIGTAPTAAQGSRLRLTGEAARIVSRMARAKGISIESFVRQAIGTEVFVQEQHARGARILIESPSGDTVREMVVR